MAAHQGKHPLAAVLVCEDFSGEKERESHSFEPDLPGRVLLVLERVHFPPMPRELVLVAEHKLAVAFEGHDKVPAEFLLEEDRVLLAGIPGIGYHVAKGQAVGLHGRAHHAPELLILGFLGVAGQASLLIRALPRGFLHGLAGNRQADLAATVEGR